MMIFLSARQYIISTSCQVISYEIRHERPYIEAAPPFVGLAIVVNLVSRRSNCSRTATYINTVTTLYIYRCTSSCINVSSNQTHSYIALSGKLHEFCTKDVYTDRNSKEYIATRKNKNNLGNAFQ